MRQEAFLFAGAVPSRPLPEEATTQGFQANLFPLVKEMLCWGGDSVFFTRLS